MDGGDWLATAHRATKSRTRLSDLILTNFPLEYSHLNKKHFKIHKSVQPENSLTQFLNR